MHFYVYQHKYCQMRNIVVKTPALCSGGSLFKIWPQNQML